MSNQDDGRVPYNQHLFNHWEDILSSVDIDMGSLPDYVEDAIQDVTSEALLDLAQDNRLINEIEYSLRVLDSRRANIRTWFFAVFRDNAPNPNIERLYGFLGPEMPSPALEHLLRFQVNLPADVETEIRSVLDRVGHVHRRALRRAQAFLRALFNQLWPNHWDLVERIMTRLADFDPDRPPTVYPPIPLPFRRPPTLVPALLAPSLIVAAQAGTQRHFPTRHTPAGSAMPRPPTLATCPPPTSARSTRSPKVTTPANEVRRYYCPKCGAVAGEGHLNDMNEHWFRSHYRSSRRQAELERQWRSGEIGPWTRDEAEGKKATQTKEEEKKSKEMKNDVGRWRRWRATDPEACERQAQVEDGYSSFDESFVNDKFKRLAGKRKAKEDKGGKKRKKGEEDE